MSFVTRSLVNPNSDRIGRAWQLWAAQVDDQNAGLYVNDLRGSAPPAP